MIAILVIWCYLGLTFFHFGLVTNRLLRLKKVDHLISTISGMFTITVVACIWAIFGRIHIEFQLFLVLLHIIILITFRKALSHNYELIRQKVRTFNCHEILFLTMVLMLLLFQSSQLPQSIDNETYYLQTIKWLNHCGFVPGLANLHIFLGQASAWHVLQSAFNFPFFNLPVNDLNGFLFFLFVLFGARQKDSIENNEPQSFYRFGLTAALLIVLMPLVNSPSTDFPVIVLTGLLFFYLLRFSNAPKDEASAVLFVLAIFTVFIKISALPVLLIPILYFFFQQKRKLNHGILVAGISTLIFLLFVTKNLILTGYPLYPTHLFSGLIKTDYAIPSNVHNLWWNTAKNYDFLMSQRKFADSSFPEILYLWFTASIGQGLIGLSLVFILLIVPFLIKKSEAGRPILIVYLTLVVAILYLFSTSPQWRFFLPYLIFFAGLLMGLIAVKMKAIFISRLLSFIIATTLVVLPVPVGQYANYLTRTDSFTWHQILIPKNSSCLARNYTPEKLGNLIYYSPENPTYIWMTGDGPLPCVHKKQLQYLVKKTGYIPQQRSKNLCDGFKSVKRE